MKIDRKDFWKEYEEKDYLERKMMIKELPFFRVILPVLLDHANVKDEHKNLISYLVKHNFLDCTDELIRWKYEDR